MLAFSISKSKLLRNVVILGLTLELLVNIRILFADQKIHSTSKAANIRNKTFTIFLFN